MDTHELAWAAGFFDGEGCASLIRETRARGGQYVHPRLAIAQADRAVLDRFREAVGCGTVGGPAAQRAGRDLWTYRLSNWREVQAVCALLWTWLSPVKREQFSRVLREVQRTWVERPDRVTRFSESQVREIRAVYGPGMGYVRLAKHFGVSPSAIRAVIKQRVHKPA